MRSESSRSRVCQAAIVGGAALICVAAKGVPDRSIDPVAVELDSVVVRNFSVTVPGTVVGVVKLNMPAPQNKSGWPITVDLRSGNPSWASVPLTVQVPMTKDSATFVVTGVAPGCPMLTASYGAKAIVTPVVVHPAPGTSQFSLTVPNKSLRWPQPSTGTFNTDGRFSGTVYLSSSNLPVVSVPASIPVKTGQTSVPFTITTHKVGCAIITATVHGRTTTSTRRTVRVIPFGSSAP